MMSFAIVKYHIGIVDFGMVQLIAVSNSTVLRKGQEMIIQAGIGEFSTKIVIHFEINGVGIQQMITE